MRENPFETSLKFMSLNLLTKELLAKLKSYGLPKAHGISLL